MVWADSNGFIRSQMRLTAKITTCKGNKKALLLELSKQQGFKLAK